MGHGGARNRSGPTADTTSGRSEARGYTLQTLPAEGYRKRAPTFPLPNPTDREKVLWRRAWRTPQACAWALPSEAWRVDDVALWVRIKARSEDQEAPAAILGQLRRLADAIGMTTAGLAEMGWKVAVDELAAARAAQPAAPAQQTGEQQAGTPRPRRLRA